MMQGTTPTHTFTVPVGDGVIKTAKVLYVQDGQPLVVKRTNDCDISGDKITVRLTQEETLSFSPQKVLTVQVRFLTVAGDSFVSKPMQLPVERCFDNEVLA